MRPRCGRAAVTLYDWLAFLDADIEQFSIRHWTGQVAENWTYRHMSHVPLRDRKDALFVNWCEITITAEKDHTVLYRNSFITNHLVNCDTVEEIIAAGRARWKSENETNNVLKTKGYHLERNSGHGTEHLSSFLLTPNLLAFLFHTVLGMIDDNYQCLCQTLGARRTFFNDIRALTRYLLFESWSHLMDFILTQLELSPETVGPG